jgi:hypothetical protein
VRIGRSHVPPNPQWRQWDELANELLCVWSNKEVDTSAAVMAVFAEMLAVVEGHDEVVRRYTPTTLTPTQVLPVILVLRLAASTIFLFPSLVAANHDAARSLAASLASLSAVLARKDAPAEMGDAIAELAEALCLANVKRTW